MSRWEPNARGRLEQAALEPASAAPLQAVAVTLESVAAAFADRRESARRRQSVKAANAEFQERQLVKLGSVAAALRECGVAVPAATRWPAARWEAL